MVKDPFATWRMNAENALRAVEAWAGGYEMLREWTLEDGTRADALLVPTNWGAGITQGGRWNKGLPAQDCWARPGLVAVEVKVSRADFLAGLKRGQYGGYAQAAGIRGVYLVTPPRICKKTEVPDGIGHLVVGSRVQDQDDDYRPEWRGVVACRRHPAFREAEVTPRMLWQILFRLRERWVARVHAAERRSDEIDQKFGHEAGRLIYGAAAGILRRVEAEVGGKAQ